MKRKLIKGILTFTLLLAMLVTMANPVSIYAEEPAVDDKKAEAGDNTETNQDLSEEKVTQESEEATEKAGNEQYDTTKPVIEKVEFPQQGTTVKADETIRLYVYAYDTGTEEGDLRVSARISSEGSSTFMEGSYDAEKGCYVCEYNLAGTSTEKVNVSSIEVTDLAGNYTEYSCFENGEYLYWVSVEPQASEEIHIKKFELKQNGQTLNEKDVLEMSLETEEDIKEGYSVYARFKLDNGTMGSPRDFSLYSSSLNTENRKKFEYRTEVGTYHADGPWTLEGIYIKKGALGKEESLDIAGIGEFLYRVKKTVPSVIKPTITSVSLDKNGEFLSAGDSVNITIGATADKGTLSEYGSVVFYAGSNFANPYENVSLTYDENAGVYQGVFEITEDTYPCEWYIGGIGISDTEYNSADDTAFTNGANYPYYVNVKNGETFTNPTYDVNISFTALNENGVWETIQEFHKEKVERRQTLKEIGVTFPEMVSKYQGFIQTGWMDYDGNPITENTTVIGNSGNMVIRAKYDKKLISASYRYRTEDGKRLYMSQKMEVPEDITYGQLREIVENVNAPEKTYPELVFQKWEMELPYDCTDESLINSNQISIYAVYDKNCVTVEYTYVDTKGNLCEKELPLAFEKEETYTSVLKKAKAYIPENITKEYEFEKWEVTGYDNFDIASGLKTIYLSVKFSGKATIPVIRYGYDENGCSLPTKALVLNEGAKGRDAIKVLKEWETPEFYQGLRFKEWDVRGIKDDETVKHGQAITMEAVYENCIVRYLIDPMFVSGQAGWDSDYDLEAVICQVVEKGETVTFRESFDGYEKVLWPHNEYQPGDTFTVEKNMTFYGYGTKASEEPDKPTPPSQPENPSQPGNPSIPAPGVSLPQDTIDNTIKIITSTESGGSVSVDMDGATVISKEILEAAKGKDVDIQLNMGGYTWTINGKDIKASNLKDINLQVILDTKNIPSKTLQALAGDNPIRQLSLVHEGDFGFKASLTVNVGSQHSGQFGNLYYHDSDGKMVFINAGKIQPDGNVSLEFSHASDYVIVMSDKEMSQSDVPAEISPAQKKEQVVSPKKSAKTGDETNIVYWMILGMIALGVCGILGRKKFYRG